MCGNSLTHGPHQLAQKSSSATLPLSDCRSTRFPSRSCSSKAIASLPTRSTRAGAAGRRVATGCGGATGCGDEINYDTFFAPSGGSKANKDSGIDSPTLATVKIYVICEFAVLPHGVLHLVSWIPGSTVLR